MTNRFSLKLTKSTFAAGVFFVFAATLLISFFPDIIPTKKAEAINCSGYVGGTSAGSISISSVSPNPADNSTTVSGTATGGEDHECGCSPGIVLHTPYEVNNGYYQVDGGSSIGISLNQTSAGTSNSCGVPGGYQQ